MAQTFTMTWGTGVVSALEVPSLALASAGNDNRPDFDVGLPMSSVVGDVVRIQSNSGGGFVNYVAHTIVSGDFTTATINKTGITSLSDGSYTYQARMERGASVSAYSATVTGIIDTVLPVLSSPTGISSSPTTVGLMVMTTKSGGTLYAVVTASATKPTAAQVKAGLNNAGVTALSSVSKAVSASGAQSMAAKELTAAGTNYAHFMHEDAYTNQSVVATSASWTQVGGAWSPADLLPSLYIDVSDAATRFQLINGTSPATTNGQVVGCINDKSSNNFHLTGTADGTTCPPLQGVGTFPYLDFDGVDDKLRRTVNLGLYTSGACTLFVAARGTPAVGRTFVAETSNVALVQYMQSNNATASSLSTFIRDESGAITMINTSDIIEPNAWDNTDNVVGITDSGTVVTSYVDGVSTKNKTYTRSGTLVPTKFCVGAELRSAGASFFAGRLYALVAVNRVIDDPERVHLVTWLAAKMGRTL